MPGPASQKVLYLHADEQKLFDKLPKELTNGWSVEKETLSYDDSEAKRRARMSFLHLKHPAFRKLRVKPPKIQSEEDLWKMFMSEDAPALNTDDTVNICFTMGPDFVGKLISALIQNSAKKIDIDLAAYFTSLRHAILSSLCTYA